MNRKYLPFIALLAAILLFYWVKTHQGNKNTRITVPAAETEGSVGFDRVGKTIRYSKHARCRMDCRHIDESEVKEILDKGVLNDSKIEDSEEGRSYPLEGTTHDNQHVRVVFAPHGNELVVVTVIDLDREWQCNCT